MRFRVSHALPVIFLVSATLALVSCGRQNEGERCSLANANSDCDDGLICTEGEELSESGGGVDRCCPSPGTPISDELCERTATNDDGDTGGEGGAGGDSASEDELSSCIYNSDCNPPLFCITGFCRSQCQTSRDCPSGEVCSLDKICVFE